MPKLKFIPLDTPRPVFTANPDLITKLTAKIQDELTRKSMGGMVPMTIEINPSPTGGIDIRVTPKPQTSAGKDETEIVQEVMSQMFRPAPKMQYDRLVKEAIAEALKDLPAMMRESANG